MIIQLEEARNKLRLMTFDVAELPVLNRLRELAADSDPELEFGYFDHNPVGFL